MSKHHSSHKRKHPGHEGHDHDYKRKPKPITPHQDFDGLLVLLKKLVEAKENQGMIKVKQLSHDEACLIGKYSAKDSIHGDHAHITQKECSHAIKEIAKKIQTVATPLSLVSQKPNEIIYGNANDPDEQIKYTFSEGTWLVTPGKNVDAIIIDPAGKVIEITPGPHIDQYGEGGNLTQIFH